VGPATGRDERNAISRIEVENLPRTCQAEAKKIGPLGLLRLQVGPDERRALYIGPLNIFEFPDDFTRNVIVAG